MSLTAYKQKEIDNATKSNSHNKHSDKVRGHYIGPNYT